MMVDIHPKVIDFHERYFLITLKSKCSGIKNGRYGIYCRLHVIEPIIDRWITQRYHHNDQHQPGYAPANNFVGLFKSSSKVETHVTLDRGSQPFVRLNELRLLKESAKELGCAHIKLIKVSINK